MTWGDKEKYVQKCDISRIFILNANQIESKLFMLVVKVNTNNESKTLRKLMLGKFWCKVWYGDFFVKKGVDNYP